MTELGGGVHMLPRVLGVAGWAGTWRTGTEGVSVLGVAGQGGLERGMRCRRVLYGPGLTIVFPSARSISNQAHAVPLKPQVIYVKAHECARIWLGFAAGSVGALDLLSVNLPGSQHRESLW